MTTMLFSVIFGSIGVGYFIYGKKQQKPIPLIVGVALCVAPYAVSDPYMMAALGTALTLIPWFIKR